MINIPQINLSDLTSVDLSTEVALSPSQVQNLSSGCPGKNVLQRKFKAVGMSDKALLYNPFFTAEGNALHIMAAQYAGKKEIDRNEFSNQVEGLYNEQIQKTRKKWPMLIKDVKGLDYDKVKCLRQLLQRQAESSGTEGTSVREKEIDCSKDLKLKGTPDYLWVNGNSAIIRDLKTGRMTDEDGKVKPAYAVQLNLYRLMVQNKYPNVTDVKMEVYNPRNERLQVDPIADDELEQIIQDALCGKFRPGDACKMCPYGHVCSHKAWPEPSLGEYIDFLGEVQVNDGCLAIYDDKRKISLNIHNYTKCSELYETLLNKPGCTVMLTGILIRMQNPLVGIFTPTTIVCEITKHHSSVDGEP